MAWASKPPAPARGDAVTARCEDVFKRSLERALAAFDADQHGTRGWGTLVDFVERYLKPAFVAHACGLDAARELRAARIFPS